MPDIEDNTRQKDWPNLRSPEYVNSQHTPEQRREQASRAGKASGRAKILRKTQAEILRQILALPTQDEKKRELLQSMGLEGNIADQINWAVSDKAQSGDVEAIRYVRDTIGEKPREGLELGNLDNRPLETLDLSKMSDAQLQQLAENRKKD